jgi:tetratricopeptide (TPR) repeat protein
MPHSPQAFGENGDAPNPSAPESDKYFNEVLYANKKIIRLVDHIFINSKTLPINLIQGDHWSLSHITNSPDGNMIKKKFSNLSAYHLSNGGKDRLYNTITPVNSFRLIFDRYFGTALGTLEGKSYLPSHTPRGKMITVPTEDSLNTDGLLAWIASLKRSILRKPDFAELHVLLGAYYSKLNYLPEAIIPLGKALSLNPSLPWAFINLGQVYAHSKNYSKGLGAVCKAIALNPKILEAYELLGKIQFEQGKYEEAILAINKVLKADPNRLVANDIAGKTYFLLNDKERALSYLKKEC